MFGVHFAKLRENGLKSTISFKAQKELVKFNMQYRTAINCITTNKIIREIGGASGKNDSFPTVPILLSILPQNYGTPFQSNLCFWDEQDLGNLQLKKFTSLL